MAFNAYALDEVSSDELEAEFEANDMTEEVKKRWTCIGGP